MPQQNINRVYGSKNFRKSVIAKAKVDFEKSGRSQQFKQIVGLLVVTAIMAISTSALAIGATRKIKEFKLNPNSTLTDELITRATAYSIATTNFNFALLSNTMGISPKVLKVLQNKKFIGNNIEIPVELQAHVKPLSNKQQIFVLSQLSLAYDIEEMRLIATGKYTEDQINEMMMSAFDRNWLNAVSGAIGTINPDDINFEDVAQG